MFWLCIVGARDGPHPVLALRALKLGNCIPDFAVVFEVNEELSSAEGAVVVVMGLGEISFVNLMTEEFISAPAMTVVEFNLWMFGRSEQLDDVFFEETTSERSLVNKSAFDKITDDLNENGDVFSPIATIIAVRSWRDRI